MSPSSPTQANTGAAHKRRQYAKDQTAAYDYSGAGGAAAPQAYAAQGQYQDASQPYPGQQQQQQFFSPAFGDPNAPQQHMQQPQPNAYYGQGQTQTPIGPGAPVHGRSISQQYPGQQQGYQQPGVAGLANQFGQMGLAGQQRPVRVSPYNFDVLL